MKLWLLKRHDEDDFDWDEAVKFVIYAESEERARALAQAEGGGETGWRHDKPFWTDASLTTCTLLPETAESEGVVVRDFHAG